ncbi:MAG: ferritin-like domain-containing protein [Polyangiaceae bacterium]|nr:ferritin-like domain-containing protein [Polyangiaceae bacterium]
MLDARNLKRLFKGILVASFVPGCGGVDRDQFTTNACTGNNDLDGLTATPAVDYMELRQTVAFSEPPMTEVIAKQGSACANASGTTCSDTLATLTVTGGWTRSSGFFDGGPTTRYLVFTRGDEVGAVASLDDLKKFLAPIENPRDAIFLIDNELSGHRVICEENNTAAVDDGFHILTTSGTACGEGSHRDEHVVHVSSTGVITVKETVVIEEGDSGCVIGRRPEGLIASNPPRGARSMGAYFAEASQLEAASVFAFERLEGELRTYRAPRTLVRDARRARNDEVRHARMTRRLAKKNGGTPVAARVRQMSGRAWMEFVKENAVEGCIRETFGALVATYQAQHATDEHIKRAMGVIANDETRHASLAWRVAKWAEARLSAEERAEVRALQRAELQRMRCHLSHEDAPLPAAGYPGRDESIRLLAGFSAAIGMG